MKHGLKLALGIALICALTVGIAACGGGSTASSGGAAGGAEGSSGENDLSGTLTIWDPEFELLPAYTKAIEQITAEFEKVHSGVEVDHVAEPYENYETLYRAAFAAHEGPDIMQIPAAILSFRQGLEVLDPHISPELQEELTLWQNVSVGYEEEGEHVGIPIGLNGWVFYYNKKLFAEAGLPTNFEPKTWADVREAGEKLKQAGIQPFVGGNKEGSQNSFWFGVGYETTNSREQIDELAKGGVDYTEESVTKGFGPQIEMNEAGLFPSSYFDTPLPEGFEQFTQGKGAMVLGFWNALGYWGEFNPELGEKNVGIFLPPENSGALGAVASQMWGIPTFAKNKEAAWAFLEFLASKHSIEVLDEVGQFMPNRDDVSIPENSPVQERELLEASRQRGTDIAAYAVLPTAVASVAIPNEISQVLQGRTSLESAQEAIQEEAEKAGY